MIKQKNEKSLKDRLNSYPINRERNGCRIVIWTHNCTCISSTAIYRQQYHFPFCRTVSKSLINHFPVFIDDCLNDFVF